MKTNRLANIQWRSVRLSMGVSFTIFLAVLGFMLFYYQLDPRVLIASRWFGIPFIILLLLISAAVGFGAGYVFGNRLKKRLEKLIESILKYENGNFAYRIPSMGEDEIGLAADQLNEMAERIERQVASLQKLSNERAEWQDQMKKSVVSEERQRLARELHDAVSQQLFAISMMTSAILEGIAASADEKLAQRLKMVEKMAADAQSEMRALLLHLRPVTLEGKGLREGLSDLLNEFKAKQSMDIDWEIEDTGKLPKGVEDHLFRIVQEALSNVFRHSKATKVSVRLLLRNRQLQLKVIDNGEGFQMDSIKTSSYGLNSIKERASEVGGVAEIISFAGKGTQVDVKVPIFDQGKGENQGDSSTAD
ncbi:MULTISPECIES: two-component system sensor histidine kinase LiaS [Bacillus]|uniref:Sensor histidine kinase n=1 Tax=Bacillus glycinifermentans TaxID=1664069 RepID=A0AAJ3Z161_9BACI|nr:MULTISPECIES: two-component system sensor histidine kinase LiaS [Bacillus]KKB75432.1 histidine kinase [Bacillus sp. TH008]MBU8785505.1 sensor histidine kinase [Bacillus glycinifermentans]MDU0070571.1 two-component system sensor histidine kinase LiaS [Bacillus sp. IG6]MED8018435.1 two-component system sensor histidine kinase LiaS [Bacillus glycinifermentans]NUJ15824.1 sensor histidine kinase [Bacillus glycinifermentans]